MKLVFKVLLIIIIYGSLSVKAEEALQTIQIKDLQKLNTKQTKELLIGTVSFGYYQNGKTFEEIHYENGDISGVVDNQTYNGTYKIEAGKVCYKFEKWECVIIYQKKKEMMLTEQMVLGQFKRAKMTSI